MPLNLFVRQTSEQIERVFESSAANTILKLNGQGRTAVGVGSPSLSIDDSSENVGYLITGRYHTSEKADPKIGIRWLLEDSVSWNDNTSSYVVQQSATRWTRFGAVFTPPDNANGLQYWVLNVDADSSLYVDNLGLFRIPLPCRK